MYSWFSEIVDIPAGFEEMVASGTVLAALAVLIFLFYLFARLFK